MSDLKARVRQLASEFAADTIKIRQHIHANPELSFQEFQTSAGTRKRKPLPCALIWMLYRSSKRTMWLTNRRMKG